MDISNNFTAALGLPNGQTVPARGSVSVSASDWSEMKDHPVVKAWLAERKIAKSAEADPEPQKRPLALDGLSDDELRIFLKEHNVQFDGRSGRDKLLAEARKVDVSKD